MIERRMHSRTPEGSSGQRDYQAATAHFARRLWYEAQLAIPVDMEYVAGILGLRLVYREAARTFRGELIYGTALQPTMLLNACNSQECNRYVAAHESGHFLLDTGKISAPRGLHERLCQLFAATLLMPPDLVQHAAGYWWGRHDFLPAMAWQFGVSRSAMRIQLQRLRLIDGAGPWPTVEEAEADVAPFDDLLAQEVGPRTGLVDLPDLEQRCRGHREHRCLPPPDDNAQCHHCPILWDCPLTGEERGRMWG